jgi:hypothetical protein
MFAYLSIRLLMFGWLIPAFVFACDFCTLYTGVLPQDRMNRLELTYRMSRFSNGLKPLNSNSSVSGSHLRTAHQTSPDAGIPNHERLNEQYQFVEIRYSFFPISRLQMSLHLPYQNYREEEGRNSRERNGFGDFTAFGQYAFVAKEETKYSLKWFAGLGGRVPTGWYYRNPERYADYFFEQGGRGNWGLMLLSTLNYRKGNFGNSTIVNWNWIAARPFGYRPGSILNINQYFFQLINLKYGEIRLLPAANLYMELTEGNRNGAYQVMNTGGISILGGPDVSLYLNRWMIRTGLQLPVYERLNGQQPMNRWRMQIGMAWNFGKEKC